MKASYLLRILVMAFAFVFCFTASSCSQEVKREGNTFTQVSSKRESSKGKETKTEYVFKDSKGNEYPIFLSSTGKAFVKKVSKKSGKEYKQYIPEVGRQINPDAYKEEKKKS